MVMVAVKETLFMGNGFGWCGGSMEIKSVRSQKKTPQRSMHYLFLMGYQPVSAHEQLSSKEGKKNSQGNYNEILSTLPNYPALQPAQHLRS
jgi:hypothetical protein